MANVYDDQGKYDEALAMHEKSLSIRLKKLGDDHPDVASTYNNMANVYQKQGKYEEALAMYEKTLLIDLKKLGGDHPLIADTYENIGVLYDTKLNKYKEALY